MHRPNCQSEEHHFKQCIEWNTPLFINFIDFKKAFDSIHKNYAKQTGLNVNAKKTKVMSINTRNTKPITINDLQVDSVEDFTYLESNISKDNGTGKDIKARISKACATFARLHTIWKSNQYSLRTKLRIYNSNVKSVLLYGSETWRVLVSDLQKVDAFHTSCLRKINRIFWPNKIKNKSLLEKCNAKSITAEIKQRRFKWLGHVLRMPQHRTPKTALYWTPPGKRKPGRPRITRRRTVTA